MLKIFVTVHINQSDLMRQYHKNGVTVLGAKGGFNEAGQQGWWVTLLPSR